MKKITIDIEGEDLQAGQVVALDYTALEKKAALLALGYRAGKSILLGELATVYGTSMHQMARDDGPPPARQKPWKKGFIPTVGKTPELPAPHVPEWRVVERQGNRVSYERTGEANPFSFSQVRITADLLTRRWCVMKMRHEAHDSYAMVPVFEAPNVAACLLYIALDDDLKLVNATQMFVDYVKDDLSSPLNHQLDTYRNLFTNTGRYRKP